MSRRQPSGRPDQHRAATAGRPGSRPRLRRRAAPVTLERQRRSAATGRPAAGSLEGFLAGVDLLVTPSMACLPPLVGAWRTGTEDDPLRALRNSYPMGVFTSVFNVTGQPAISLPVHHDEATGLPVGIQIVAAPWREDLLLQVSRALELALPWAGRRPTVS
ncbi:amidase family protein [Streptomyces sp. NPDC056910]|uniref:amidase family protein n=1 Tax=Streptomyces sp. NPDC056910 TaxID=3345964 RepID=UPI00369F87DC